MKTMDELKHAAAMAALDEIRDGMIVGLGTGSTATHFIRALGARVGTGLKVLGIPTSEESRALAAQVGVPLTTLKDHPQIDVTIDGADEVSSVLDLIKGLGGALVREKIVAHSSKRVIIVVDENKLVDRLGRKAPVPVEVVPFAADTVSGQLYRWGGEVKPREKNGKPFISDNGNVILDWYHGVIDHPQLLEKQIKGITGVVDSGIFAHVAAMVIVGTLTGIHKLQRPS
jgi:ribose 5-phosphate isomerase A